MESRFASDTAKRIMAGDSVYYLKIFGEKFVLSRHYSGRGLDQEWSGKFINKSFEFDEKPEEDLQIYVKDSEADNLIIMVKGKHGCLGNRIKEFELTKE